MIRSWDLAEPGRRSAPEVVVPTEAELRARYLEYRARQARRLVALVPREAIRPLYRLALDRAGAGGAPQDREGSDDPLALLVELCEEILPLPPFEAWCEDLRRAPGAHLLELSDAPDAPTAAAPATLETRRLRVGDRTWMTRLRGFRDRDAWRGFVTFEDPAAGHVHRTAIIFRERDPRELRRRFLDFESSTLEAFLRSAIS